MSGTYIIYSKKLKRFYIGATQQDVYKRIEMHNEASYGKSKYTSKTNDWELFLFIPTTDFTKAIRIERKIKSMKSSKYIENLQKHPELIEKLLANN
jgi:putative endonuclease